MIQTKKRKNTFMENTLTTTAAAAAETANQKGVELAPGRILPGGIWEINPLPPESEMHPDDLNNPIGS